MKNIVDFARAESHCESIIVDLRQAHLSGRRKLCWHKSKLLLNSYDARLLATRKAWRSLPKHRRPPAGDIPKIAQQLDPWQGTNEPALLLLKDKGDGNARCLIDFGIENRALHYLIGPVLKAQSNPHPAQFGLIGRDAATMRVATLLTEGPGWAIETDIQNCFPSFDGDRLKELLPLPKEVTENVVLSRNLRLTLGPNSTFGPADDAEDDELLIDALFADARSGIPQGSAASPLVCELVVASVYEQINGSGHLAGYADNTLVLAQDEEEAVSMTLALWAALKASPAGQLRPKEPSIHEPGAPIDFLGYRLSLSGGSIEIEPSAANRQKFEARFSRDIARIKRSESGSLRRVSARRLSSYVRSWTAAHSLWGDADECRTRAMSRIASAVDAP